MKKIATVFTAILLAAAMLLPQAMLADQGAVFTMNGTDNVPAGGTFDVTLSVSGEYAIHAAHLSVEYDPNSHVWCLLAPAQYGFELYPARLAV